MITSEEIKRRLWDGANELRGSMDASRYKDYMLGLMFYKFLSDKTLDGFRRLGQYEMNEEDLLNQYYSDFEDLGEKLTGTIQQGLGYFVEPEYLYQSWIRDINEGHFEVQKVTDSFNTFERNISMSSDADDFKGLFANSTLDLSDTALGNNLNERSKNIKSLILLFSDLNMVELQDGDVLGDAYEYLIGQFAMESGKKAGEFYTPRRVSEVLAQIVARSGKIESIYDPAVGSGSLLLTVGRHLDKDSRVNLHYYGQEKNTATYNLTRMNLLLHDVKPQKMTIRNGDTLAEDWPEDPNRPNEGVLFDAVVMNPPYSLKRWNRSEITVSDPRFESVGVLPPDSKGDYAFLLHGLYHLDTNGTMAILLPHGVLFRGASEGVIRQRLLEKNYFDTIIGLPSNMFTNTGIPVIVAILKKNRPLDEPLLIIDASKDFVKEGKVNVLREKDVAKVVDTYLSRKEEQGYSHLATREEIINNDFNLNIPRYVDSFVQEIPHDVDAHLYGGIPQKDIDQLHVLNLVVPDLLIKALLPIRKGYVKLSIPVEQLREDVLNHQQIRAKSDELRKSITDFINLCWKQLHHVNNQNDVKDLMEKMLLNTTKILDGFSFIDVYDGYQIIADTWRNSISRDMELITALGFYDAGRQRERNMITKGSGRNQRLEQDGWIGSIVPNELVESMFFQKESNLIFKKQQRVEEIENELTELVDAAKDEESDEYSVLYDILKMNSDDEPGDSFDTKILKTEITRAQKGSEDIILLQHVDNIMKERNMLNREIKTDKKTLDDKVQEKIPSLTDEEIDILVYQKWFGDTIGSIVSLIHKPLNEELEILDELNNRYADTISNLDEQIASLEKDVLSIFNEMVICDE
ncbi:MAG: type I restriction-modification system subunit M [Eubacteriales bacterium]|nr:type I restriction-modification system subunit M [Eubacteriales bacterium]